AGAQFQDVAERLPIAVRKYEAAKNDFNTRTGLDIKEGEAIDDKSKLSKSDLDEAMKLGDRKKKLDMHTNISYAIWHEVKSRKLDEFVAIEEQLIENRQVVSHCFKVLLIVERIN